MEPVSDAFTDSHPQRGRRKRLAVIETQPSRFVRHTRRCEAEFPVPISDAGACVPHTRTGTCSSGQDAARCTCIHTAVGFRRGQGGVQVT